METIRTDQQPGTSALPGRACKHSPQCPPAGAPGRLAARVIATHPEQGWSLLCNGVIAFDYGGAIAPEDDPAILRRPRVAA
jgi:hypothetical protein